MRINVNGTIQELRGIIQTVSLNPVGPNSYEDLKKSVFKKMEQRRDLCTHRARTDYVMEDLDSLELIDGEELITVNPFGSDMNDFIIPDKPVLITPWYLVNNTVAPKILTVSK